MTVLMNVYTKNASRSTNYKNRKVPDSKSTEMELDCDRELLEVSTHRHM